MDDFGVDRLTWGYPGEQLLFRGLTWKVRPGRLVCLLGRNGCGKTSLLLVAAGVDPSCRFQFRFSMAPPRRDIHFALQEGEQTLLPWRSTLDNIAAPALLRGVELARARSEAEDLLFSCSAFQELVRRKNHYAYQLSGGLRQLAVVARAFVARARVAIFDEPFKGLDLGVRGQVHKLLLELLAAREDGTVVMVTHSVEEALLLADEVHLIPSWAFPVTAIRTVEIRQPRPRDLGSSEINSVRQIVYHVVEGISR